MGKTYSISIKLGVLEKFSVPLNKLGGAFNKISAKARNLTERIRKMGKAWDKIGNDFVKGGEKMMKGVSLPLLAIAGLALRSSAKIETLRISFESLLGSTEAAKKTMEELIDFAAKTPFQIEGIGRAAKQLLAANVESKNLKSTLKVLGDIAAGADVPLSDMASIFAKIKNKGKAMTEEILQLSDRGIPIINVLADQMGVAKDQIFDMASKGKISFDVITKAMKSMSEKGGVFEDQMKKQSNTLNGVFSTLKDNGVLALVALGDQIVQVTDLKTKINSLIKSIQDITKGFKEFTANNPGITEFLFTLTGILAVMGPSLFLIGKIIKAYRMFAIIIGAVKAGLLGQAVATNASTLALAANRVALIASAAASKIAAVASAIFNAVLNANPIMLIATAIIGAAALIIANWESVKDFFVDMMDVVGKVFDAVINPFGIGGKKEIVNTSKIAGKIGDSKSETDINLKVQAEPGTSVLTDKVSRKKGAARVKTQTSGYTGNIVPVAG